MKKILLLIFCLSAFSLSNAQRGKVIDEDFGKYRPKYNYQPEVAEVDMKNNVNILRLPFDSTTQKLDITFELNRMLDFIPPVYTIKSNLKYFEGYRIQIYRGKSREEASKARQRSYEIFPNLTPYIEYSAPTYRVKVGDFLEPFEYERYYKVLRKEFQSAIVVPALVKIILVKENH